MGNDGGSIPSRRELVREAARLPSTSELKESQTEAQAYYWSTDPLSRQPLKQPIVSDYMGRLYNKDSVLEVLLSSEAERAEAEKILQGTVKSLKDVVNVKFEENDKQEWICPITNERLGVSSKAVYLVPCGHAFAAAALKEIKGDQCVQCETGYAENDVIPILPTVKEDIARLSSRVKDLMDRGLTHSLRRAKAESKKKRKHGDTGEAKEERNGSKAGVTLTDIPNIKNSATASMTAKVMQEQEERNKKRRAIANENLDSLFTKDKGTLDRNNKDFMTRGFAIPAKNK
jgi:hypothetical protein